MSLISTNFKLEAEVAALGGSGTTKEQQIVLFLGVLAGAVAKAVYDAIRGETKLTIWSLVIAVIASVLVFPTVYDGAGLKRGALTLGKWCVAFQNGFFWGVLMNQIEQAR